MDWISKLERKMKGAAIPNLTLWLVGLNCLGYIIRNFNLDMLSYLTLEPGLILQGQVWRILTWILIPTESNVLLAAIMLFFYFSVGGVMERTWGAFRYNLYIFSGLFFTVLGAFLLYAILGEGVGYGYYFSLYYVCLSIFLAFAASYPDMQVLLYFFIPLKVKWLALLDVAYLAYALIQGNIASRTAIIASLLNFILFFVGTRGSSLQGPRQKARRAKFKRDAGPKMRYTGGAKHRCALCGRTELDDPKLEFRYCSKCNGNYEFCQDHLFNHVHIK